MSLYFEDEDIPRAKQTLSLQPQHTSADGSFSVKAKHSSVSHLAFASIAHISSMASLIHILLLIFSDSASIRLFSFLPVHPSFSPPSPSVWIVTRWSSEHTHIARCLILQKNAFLEELVFEAAMRDRVKYRRALCIIATRIPAAAHLIAHSVSRCTSILKAVRDSFPS